MARATIEANGWDEAEAGEVSFRFGEFIRAETSLQSLYSSTTIPAILLAWEIHRSGIAWKNSACENEVKQTSSTVVGGEEG